MILEAMYNGEFYPCETVVPTSPEYRKAIQTCAALMEQLSQRLSKEDYALVEELRAQNAIAQCEESESHFKYGFSAGLIVQQEAHEQLQNKKLAMTEIAHAAGKREPVAWAFCVYGYSVRSSEVSATSLSKSL